jgi:hypothetical protein
MYIFKKIIVRTAILYRYSVIQEDAVVDLPLQAAKDVIQLHDWWQQIFQLLIFKEYILLCVYHCVLIFKYIFNCNWALNIEAYYNSVYIRGLLNVWFYLINTLDTYNI